MHHSREFVSTVLDGIPANISVLDHQGLIVYVNERWKRFGVENGIPPDYNWHHVNYLDTCRTTDKRAPYLREVSQGIKSVIGGKLHYFETEYPCDSPQMRRWFLMGASRLFYDGYNYCCVMHTEITKRKMIGEEAELLSLIDPLTGLSNRRGLDRSLATEWQRAVREKQPMSLIMLDIDLFKQVNDSRGHVFGDKCIADFGILIQRVTRRSTDIAARLGGEEFVIVLPNANQTEAVRIARNFMAMLAEHNFGDAAESTFLTVSIGIYTGTPKREAKQNLMLEKADAALYQAKQQGRNRYICCAD